MRPTTEMRQSEDLAEARRQARERSARIREARAAVLANRFRIEQQGSDWAIIRNSDQHPIVWANTKPHAEQLVQILSHEYDKESARA